jgi:hypothetical protein
MLTQKSQHVAAAVTRLWLILPLHTGSTLEASILQMARSNTVFVDLLSCIAGLQSMVDERADVQLTSTKLVK